MVLEEKEKTLTKGVRRRQRQRKRKKPKEEMLRIHNEYDNKDLTPYNAAGTMIYRDFAIKY